MGRGIDLALGLDLESGGTGIHAKVLDDFKDQLLIVFLKRMREASMPLMFSVTDVDDTGQDLVSFSIVDGVFEFVLAKTVSTHIDHEEWLNACKSAGLVAGPYRLADGNGEQFLREDGTAAIWNDHEKRGYIYPPVTE